MEVVPASGDSRPLVFISHVHQDGAAVSILQHWLDDLFAGGLRFFNTSDRHTLQLGSKWLQAIESGLASARTLIAILTPAGLRSPWVNFETGGAWLHGARVVPCCVPPLEKSTVPPPYSHLQGMNLLDVHDLDYLVESLAADLGRRPPTFDAKGLVTELEPIFAASPTTTGDTTPRSQGGVRYEELEIEWRYRRSTVQDEAWAAVYRYQARFVVIAHEKPRHTVEFNRSVDVIPFRRDAPPIVTVEGTRRWGGIRRGRPYRQEGSSYAFAVHFDPPLIKGEEVTLDVLVDFPAYKPAYKEPLLEALMESDDEISDIDYNARTINDETRHFLYRVIIPKTLGARPVAPTVMYRGAEFPEEIEVVRHTPGIFAISEEDLDGEASWIMTLDRRDPPHQSTYRMRWRPPARTAQP